ncbi:MurR/RpiR family transcriptional regulator [Brevibacillus humidisoli]|uniref:MurR/RpiR family transcriptional regulator n=1 Tax=Brevibacillus humidisoli TaxID=2895522 RepID=UPI001E2C1A91|nr:MurR/RpiR family transcriptional regulator [Brevibacillus humidisoli]UFJ40723.1 MurR/RpiR family transcriptional regulator [Brevibacillus humidisoli]
MEPSNVYQHIAEKMQYMSKSQLKIAKYILENTNSVPFLNVAKLAKKAKVSEATVVRFATFLGFSGYPELQQYMQDSVKQQLTIAERLEMSLQEYGEEEKGVYEIFQDDIANLKSTMEKLDIQSFLKAVDLLLHANKVYVVANRSAVALGAFLQYYLNIVLGNTEMIQSAEMMAERLYQISEQDVVIGISFARYSNSTIDILSYAKGKGANTIAITDNLLSPLIPHADISLTASSQMPTFIDSFVAPLSLINALITFVGKHKMSEFHERLEKLEEIWDHLGIFHMKEKE